MTSLKQGLKQILMKNRQNKYNRELAEKKMSYDTWIRKQESEIQVDDIIVSQSVKCLKNGFLEARNAGNENQNDGFHSESDLDCRYYEVFDKNEGKSSAKTFLLLPPEISAGKRTLEIVKSLKNSEADVILFQTSEGEFADFALPLIYRTFRRNENIILIYGDEDVCENGVRSNPWFKPDWSPDTFLSCFYFGSVIALQKSGLELLGKEWLEEADFSYDLYELCNELIKIAGGFCKHNQKESNLVCHLPEIVFHAQQKGYEAICDWKLQHFEGKRACREMISVIIPSKDNPKVLFTCIHSLLQKTEVDDDYEIIIVDNGSNVSNKTLIEEEIQKLNQQAFGGKHRLIRYYHQPMVFNFSQMCNMGAEYANGNYLLFLNDDMEIVQNNWLSLLMDKATLSYAGAVGAKLLYPNSAIIQHAGITNLRVGPAHKLQFLSDEENHNFGRNRGVHDMMAVTGACLLVRKDIFRQVGGFAEELAVAFNDVDLCYKIYEAGYYNIVRNDVVLYHHESLSRGKDGESEEKQKRLLHEKDVLYEKHQKLYGKDPFYHKYFTGDMLESEYSPAYHYQVRLDMPWAKVTPMKCLPQNVREDNCVVIGMEGAMDIYKWKYGVAPGRGECEPKEEELGYYFQGYTFVIGADNACYKNTLLLENKATKQVFCVEVQKCYRPDIKKNLKDQLNVDLTGFAAKVRWNDIPKGEYRFAMLAEDTCSRQKLVSYSSWVLLVDGLLQQVSDTLPRK